VIDHTAIRIEDAVDPVNLVFDTAGGERLEGSPAVLSDGGRLVSIATDPPPAAVNRDISALYFVVEPNRVQLVELAKLADQGRLQATIDRTYALAEARAAFERSLSRHGRGKVVSGSRIRAEAPRPRDGRRSTPKGPLDLRLGSGRQPV
jgi:NADPH:quinone reductase-like Zn-dependent oxidoreductase